jgi:PAS domain S-box-containing protein
LQQEPARRFRITDDQSIDEIVRLLLDGETDAGRRTVTAEADRPIDRDLIARELRRARAEQILARFECARPSSGGWIEVLAYPDADGLAISVWDINERKRAEAALVESEASYRDLFEEAPIGYQEVDLEGRFTRVNRTQLTMLGYSADEVLGRHIWEFEWAHGEDPRETRRRFFDKMTSGQLPPTFERVRVRKDGTLLPVLVEDRFMRDASGRIVGLRSTMLDITRRKWTDELLAGERRVLEMIARGQPLADVLDVLARAVEDLAGDGLLASILLLDDEGVHLCHGAAPSLPDEYIRAIDGVAIGPGVGSCGTAAYRGEPVIVTDIAADPLWTAYPGLADLAEAHGLRACWSTPIVGSGGRVLGTFAMYYRTPRAPSAEHRRLATLVGRTAAIVIERKRADETSARLSAIVKASDDAIVGQNLEGAITQWNRGAERLYGYAASEMVGLLPVRLIPADRLDEYQDTMDRVRRGEHVPAFDTVRLHRDGHQVEVSLSLAPIVEEPGAVTGVSAIGRDISGRRALERLQREFLAMVTHELRNPLTTVKGFAQLLRERGTYSQQAIEMIVEQSEVLERLINDLIDASRVQLGRLQLERSSVDLVAQARVCVEQARRQTTAHKIGIQSPDGPLMGRWDRTRLGQIFSNLLTNAIKYSPEGGEIVVQVEDLGTEARISVSDQGRGIAPEHLPRLFERFYRVDAAQAARSLGLGLYITRAIVMSHGGRIWAESAGEGRGSRFLFTLPYAEISADHGDGAAHPSRLLEVLGPVEARQTRATP